MTARLISTDKRLPLQVWEEIFAHLYPSQLSRLSMVSKTFYSIITSLPIWIRLFEETHPNKELRVLRGRTASTSCMIYMCAISLHFCEECQKLTPFQQGTADKLPLPVLVVPPNTFIEKTTITSGRVVNPGLVGNMINFNWRIRKCIECRDKSSIAVARESIPVWDTSSSSISNNDERHYLDGWDGWEKTFPQIRHLAVLGNLSRGRWYTMSVVVDQMNIIFGGPVGVEAAKSSTRDYDEKTWSRIMWYQSQD